MLRAAPGCARSRAGSTAVADAVAGVCVRIIGGVRHIRHAAARQISQDIRPLRILLVNLMPTKIATETQIAACWPTAPCRWS